MPVRCIAAWSALAVITGVLPSPARSEGMSSAVASYCDRLLMSIPSSVSSTSHPGGKAYHGIVLSLVAQTPSASHLPVLLEIRNTNATPIDEIDSMFLFAQFDVRDRRTGRIVATLTLPHEDACRERRTRIRTVTIAAHESAFVPRDSAAFGKYLAPGTYDVVAATVVGFEDAPGSTLMRFCESNPIRITFPRR